VKRGGTEAKTVATPKPRAAAKPKQSTDEVFLLRVELEEVDPVVWRLVAIRASATLAVLHGVLQRAMGWQNYHMHEFECVVGRVGVPDPDDHVPRRDERRVQLRDVLGAPDDFLVYVYDFGDGWRHLVRLERIIHASTKDRYSMLIAGERACPPEDVGGPPGYEDFLEAIADPGHDEHKSMLKWIGGEFDPDAFDPKATWQRRRGQRQE
jgi:hypothetical protein